MWCLKDLYINKGNMSLLQDLYKSAKKILKRISVIPLTFKKSFGNKYLDANFFQ